MSPGFDNFDPVRAGDPIAQDRNGPVRAPERGVIMMPLYQKLGEDGFFIARQVRKFWLWLSWLLRKARVPALVHWLPGVSLDENDPYAVIVDTRIARFVPLQIFHLLGFRKRRWSEDRLVVSRRRHDTTSPFR
jgi:succinylglutamate desuccinylase